MFRVLLSVLVISLMHFLPIKDLMKLEKKLVVRYKVIYWPYELPMSAQTCTQPRSEVATVSVCCVEALEPISVRRAWVWGSWHLQSVHTSDHCESGGARRCSQLTSTA